MGRVEGKVAFITGAARGQGRSHAVKLASEGADIIAVDICRNIDSMGYAMATPEDLEETVRLVEKEGRRIVAVQADVREAAQVKAALEQGLAEFGKVDIVVAQAGVAGMKGEPQTQAWADVVDTNLVGTLNKGWDVAKYLLQHERSYLGGVVVRWEPEAIIAGVFQDPALRARARAGVFEHADWLELDRGTLGREEAIRRARGEEGRRGREAHRRRSPRRERAPG